MVSNVNKNDYICKYLLIISGGSRDELKTKKFDRSLQTLIQSQRYSCDEKQICFNIINYLCKIIDLINITKTIELIVFKPKFLNKLERAM